MGRSLWNMVRYAVEGTLVIGLAGAGFILLLPVMQVHQTLKGNPLWFIPKYDKDRR